MILHSKCEPDLAKDKNLPRDSYIVSYMNDNLLCYDIVRSGNQVEIFDHYHDNSYVIKSIEWTEGLINPKSFDYVPKDLSKKRRK
jgi:hypothetical protein